MAAKPITGIRVNVLHKIAVWRILSGGNLSQGDILERLTTINDRMNGLLYPQDQVGLRFLVSCAGTPRAGTIVQIERLINGWAITSVDTGTTFESGFRQINIATKATQVMRFVQNEI